MLALAGIDGLVARDEDDYVRIGARLASDPAWRAGLSERLRDAAAQLFDDPAPVLAFGDALERLVRDG